ncbi:MAG: helix-turn-helix transcriptional regulator [Betaproteobacteria bacterium]|nr:helix-turn-helix transcriptional regulator [Betaproteobacteria bacterium]
MHAAPAIPVATRPAAEQLTGPEAGFLAEVGLRIRTLRERRGMTRKALARESDVSERYLGQLEAGEGNASILLLRRISSALGVPIADLLRPEAPRKKRIALIGLRGAGKTTLGSQLAKQLNVPCVEVNEAIRRHTGLPISEVISLYGPSGYRRIERQVLERMIGDCDRAVLVVGGGVVSEEETFSLLLANCYTVWLKATPEEHMARVLAQGDFRPMAGNDEAMEDLKRILAAREPLYRKADAVVDTAGEAPEASFRKLFDIVMA